MNVEEKNKKINYNKMGEGSIKAAEEAKKMVNKKIAPPEKPKELKKATPIDPYLIKLTVKKLNVRKGPSKTSSIISVLTDDQFVKIIAELDDNNQLWGKLDSGGWINLQYTVRK